MAGKAHEDELNNYRARKRKNQEHPSPLDNIIGANALWNKEFPPPKFAVPNVIPEGVMILAGKPKLGKSWLAYHLAIAVAAGGVAFGEYRVTDPGAALYLALEDS